MVEQICVNISEEILKAQADALVQTGLAEKGYCYFNIDDGFFGGRDAEGKLIINPKRVTNGIKVMADHAHSLGLKAGIQPNFNSEVRGI